ncbi:UDP-N-acetylmuramate--L-alanine ligase [Mobiluncus mulieris]|uniref:UDP-N-acetylmuramate--L-alanine ligase n=1 Tax=Mobiluncus mulieris TaxID=2052 RepID=UPI001470362A|nr:UDP-N-acetylmuramate--L-alanine ligase [Mobiluncus mulieris]
MRDSSSNLSNVNAAHVVPAHQAFHLVGVGGAGMSVLAHLLHDLGYTVSGSDRTEADTLPELRELGVKVFVGHRAAQVTPGMIVVASSAIREDNPEIQRAHQLGLEIWHRSQALDFCTRSKDLLAVAGAHGKTTTSAMLSKALWDVGADPSFAIGGVILEYGTGARLGRGRAFVIEADESDGSFLNYAPLVEVLTNIEPDHLDHWGSREAFDQAFVDFTARIRPGGAIVACGDDAGIRRLAPRFHSGAALVSYGFGAPLPGAALVVALGEPRLGAGHAEVDLRVMRCHPEQLLFYDVLRLSQGGKHYLLDAAAALGAAAALNECVGGIDFGAFCQSLSSFTGTGRRMQFLGEIGGVRIYDDYGHHPTEVAATLGAARDLAGNGRLLVCFQPHLYSRTKTFASEFATVLSAADEVVVCGVYAARENPTDGADGDAIADLMGEKGQFISDMYAAGDAVYNLAKPGDLLLFLGAGSITHVAHDLVKAHLGAGTS